MSILQTNYQTWFLKLKFCKIYEISFPKYGSYDIGVCFTKERYTCMYVVCMYMYVCIYVLVSVTHVT
jgi:hypothetical protein